MEKRKINFENYADMHKEKTFSGVDGTEVTVRDHISYASKEDMAREFIERVVIIHDDSCVYTSNDYDKYKIFLIAKYYTDIDTDDADPEDIVNYLINIDVINDIMEYVSDDFNYVIHMFWDLFNALTTVYTDDNSLAKAFRKSFGFLFNGENITDTLSKAEQISEKTFDAFRLLHQTETENKDDTSRGIVEVGGNIINISKKSE